MNGIRNTRKVLGYVWTHPANRGRPLRAVLRAATFQLRGRLTGRPTLATIGGSGRMLVELHRTAGAKVLYANPPDWAEMWAWRRILRPGDRFIDVGSNDGAYALWAAEVGARVTAVEPDPAAAARLRRNVGLNSFDIEVLECALAAEPGRMMLTSGNDTTNHLLMQPADAGTVVEVRTLDDVLGVDRAAGIKIDVEGAERLVLAGASRALAERRIDVLQLEWNQQSERNLGETRAPLLQMLGDHGYRMFRPDQDGRLRPTNATGYGADLFAVAEGWRAEDDRD